MARERARVAASMDRVPCEEGSHDIRMRKSARVESEHKTVHLWEWRDCGLEQVVDVPWETPGVILGERFLPG